MDIHRCRFVPYPPSAINTLAFSHTSLARTPKNSASTPSTLRLALGRPNGDIEIWNPSRGFWYQESVLHSGKDRSVEGLVWVQDPPYVDKRGYSMPGRLRLFSTGYSTSVTEWDLAEGKPRRHCSGNYGEIWCVAAQPKSTVERGKQITKEEDVEPETQSIAVGCADGTLVLLSTADDDLRFSKLVARSSKKKARVLSLTFQNRSVLVAGHADSTIRVYDTRNGQQLRNMTLGAGPKGGPKETLVWSVRCLSDGSILSGDSTGTMCFWDNKTYALVQRIKAHDADILDVAVSADGQSAFSGGMDRRTVFYKRSGGGKAGANARWAKMSHSRLHEHDVKAMATFEDKSLSIMASGGLDTNPVILPIQQFGKEHHRTLSSLPQQPSLLSVPGKRLVISWWDREISIWAIPRQRTDEVQSSQSPEPHATHGRRLVAKVVLTGDESITSVTVDFTGKLLAVSTIASTKVFNILPRKNGTLKVRKIAIPSFIAQSGAKLVQFSPDSKWLCLILLADKVNLYRLDPVDSKQPHFSPTLGNKTIRLDRIHRPETRMKPENGTLGDYHRSINRIAFSADSSILAVSDLSGYLDTWVLEGHEDLMQGPPSVDDETKPDAAPPSDSSSSSDSDEEEETSPTIIYGQHWIRNPSASLLPKLPSPALVLSFRPSKTSGSVNGTPTPPATRHNPHPHSHALPTGEDRLLVITANNNRILEFHTLTGRLTDWSRRNPASVFPEKYRGLMDPAKGVIWDVGHGESSSSSGGGGSGSGRERCWVYGVNWLWMFDLAQDLQPASASAESATHQSGDPLSQKKKEKKKKALTNGAAQEPNNSSPHPHPHPHPKPTTTTTTTMVSKRKRPSSDNHDHPNDHGTTGAGGLIPPQQLHIGLGRKMQRIEGPAAAAAGDDEDGDEAMKMRIVDLDAHLSRPSPGGGAGDEDEDEDDDDDDEDDDDVEMENGNGDGDDIVALRRRRHGNDGAEGADRLITTTTTVNQAVAKNEREGERPAAGYWHTFKYRPILGIVPLGRGGAGEGEGEGEGAGQAEDEDGGGVEVVLVERPLWDMEASLPGRFWGAQEWGGR